MVWKKRNMGFQWRNKFLVIIYFFIASTLLANKSSGTTIIETEGDSLQVCALLDSCWVHRTSDPLLSVKFGENALKLIDKKRLLKLKPKTLNYLGVVYRKLGKLEKSYSYFKDALNLASAFNDSVQIGYTYNNITDYYLKKASYSIALENVLIGYQIFQKLNHKVGMAYSLNYLGEIYIRHGDYEKALLYLEEAMKLRGEDSN